MAGFDDVLKKETDDRDSINKAIRINQRDAAANSAGLARVQGYLTSLQAVKSQRDGAASDATKRRDTALADAKAAMSGDDYQKTAAAVPLTDAQLKTINGATVPGTPPNDAPGKGTYAEYVKALSDAEGALSTANAAVVTARVACAKAKLDLDAAVAPVTDAAALVAATAGAVKDATKTATQSVTADRARAAWAVQTAAGANGKLDAQGKAVDAAVTALKSATDAYGDALGKLADAEGAVPSLLNARNWARDNLDFADQQILAKVAEVLKAAATPAGPVVTPATPATPTPVTPTPTPVTPTPAPPGG